MATWKQALLNTAVNVEEHFDRLKGRLFNRLHKNKPFQIVYYRGFGSPTAVWLKGRVLRQRKQDMSTPSDNESVWNNMLATYQRFESDEVPGVTVKIDTFGASYTTVTDEEGYFEITITPPDSLPPGRAWFPVRYTLLDITQPSDGTEVSIDGHLMISPEFSKFGVISDIDDTVLVTGATSLLQAAQLTFMGNAYTRLPFAGVAAFYRALQSGPVTTLFNPIYFVSSSPWNLYDLLIDFFRIQGIPKGPILLRDLGMTREQFFKSSHEAHKLEQIRRVLSVNPQLPFVLIGDSGQKDPEIYAQVVRENPGRIMAVYLRDVSHDIRDTDVQALIREMESHNVPMLLVPDTVGAAEHAAGLGLIDSDAIPEIRAERRADIQGTSSDKGAPTDLGE
ncbi:DUF2183 domain-containing protein [Nibrella saemangeumensis]|uniref:DUF2183 domain-containing protein n=1 Tax=Nibrella saemangeumensis TaxID=1084526 RepID=A0ABP8MR69_9BACT